MPELQGFLAPIEGPNPSGVELRNDIRFHGLERLTAPANRANRLEAVKSGGTVQVDWQTVLDDAAALAASGRDLRLIVMAARALTNDGGFAGLAQGLGLLTDTLTGFWDSLHPMLRDAATPPEAATRRINAIRQIENPDDGILGDLEFLAQLAPRGIGPITGGDLAAGAMNRAAVLAEAPSGLGEKEQAAIIAAHEARVNRVTAGVRATAAEQPEVFAALTTDAAAATTALAALEAALNVHVMDNGIGVKFGKLDAFLTRVQTALTTLVAAADPDGHTAQPQTGQPINGASHMEPALNGAAAPLAAGPSGPMQVNTRRDVERSLDLIIAFYERTEPSSPIPHLARRMRKMVPMNFMQLMEEIAPSGMKEFRSVAGVFDDKSKT